MLSRFFMPATGANARRLLYLSRVTKVDVDPRLSEIAQRDRLPDADMPQSSVTRAAVQFIHDCNFRCALPRFTKVDMESLTIHALRLGKIDKVTIASHDKTFWTRVFQDHTVSDVVLLSFEDAFLPNHQDGRRDGLMILDWPLALNPKHIPVSQAIAKEFPRTIIFSHNYPLSHTQTPNLLWHQMAGCLFPSMPNDSEIPMLYNVFIPAYANYPGYCSNI